MEPIHLVSFETNWLLLKSSFPASPSWQYSDAAGEIVNATGEQNKTKEKIIKTSSKTIQSKIQALKQWCLFLSSRGLYNCYSWKMQLKCAPLLLPEKGNLHLNSLPLWPRFSNQILKMNLSTPTALCWELNSHKFTFILKSIKIHL